MLRLTAASRLGVIEAEASSLSNDFVVRNGGGKLPLIFGLWPRMKYCVPHKRGRNAEAENFPKAVGDGKFPY